MSGLERGSRGDTGLNVSRETWAHTTFNVEDVVFVQRPATEVGRVQLEPLQQGRPLLPQDEAGAGLVLKPHRHWKRRGGRAGTRALTDCSRAPLGPGNTRSGNTRPVPKPHARRWADGFLPASPHDLKSEFQAELNLETLHRSTLWGWKDLSKEQLAFTNDPRDVEGEESFNRQYHPPPSWAGGCSHSARRSRGTCYTACFLFSLARREADGLSVMHREAVGVL